MHSNVVIEMKTTTQDDATVAQEFPAKQHPE